MYAIILFVNRIYGIVYVSLLLISIILLFFSMTSINQLEYDLEDLKYSDENNLKYIEKLIDENKILSSELKHLQINNSALLLELDNLILAHDNDLITQANLTITGPFKNYEIQIDGRTVSVVNGSITNFGLQDAHEIEVEITWWILNDCGCDAIPTRTELVEIDHVSSSSVYFFEETFPFTFEKFEFLVIGINWK